MSVAVRLQLHLIFWPFISFPFIDIIARAAAPLLKYRTNAYPCCLNSRTSVTVAIAENDCISSSSAFIHRSYESFLEPSNSQNWSIFQDFSIVWCISLNFPITIFLTKWHYLPYYCILNAVFWSTYSSIQKK